VLAWLSVWSKVQTCTWPSWCHCHPLSLASVKSKLVLPFWYRLIRVVMEKGPLNRCCCTRHIKTYGDSRCNHHVCQFIYTSTVNSPVRSDDCAYYIVAPLVQLHTGQAHRVWVKKSHNVFWQYFPNDWKFQNKILHFYWTLNSTWLWNYKNFIIIIIMQHLMRRVSVIGATNRKTLTKLRHHNCRSSSVFLHFTGNMKNCDISATGWPTSIYVHYIWQDDVEWVLQVLRLLKKLISKIQDSWQSICQRDLFCIITWYRDFRLSRHKMWHVPTVKLYTLQRWVCDGDAALAKLLWTLVISHSCSWYTQWKNLQYQAKRLTGKNVSEMINFVSSGT